MPSSGFQLRLDRETLLRQLVRRKLHVCASLRIEEVDIASRVDGEGLERPPVYLRAEEVVTAAPFGAAGEIQWEDEVADLHAVDLVGLDLDRIADFEPVVHEPLGVLRVRALNQQIVFG